MNIPKTCLTLTCRYDKPTVLLAMLILVHLSSMNIRSQGRITAIEKNLRSANPTKEVTVIRGRTRRAEPRVTVSMALEMGDELISKGGRVTVKARCGNATDLVLSGPFRVRFLRPNNQGCNVYNYPVPGGRLNVSSSVPTNVQSGDIRLATRRTNADPNHHDAKESKLEFSEAQTLAGKKKDSGAGSDRL